MVYKCELAARGLLHGRKVDSRAGQVTGKILVGWKICDDRENCRVRVGKTPDVSCHEPDRPFDHPLQILQCEAAHKKDLELDKATAEVLKKRDEERARAKQQLKLDKMTPKQLAEAEARAAETKAIGLDCEMVGVGPEGSRDCLAKIAICNEKGQPLYIRHVIPTEQVVDYRGHITGLRAEHLTAKGGAVTFEQAQARVSQMVCIILSRLLTGHLLNPKP
jgi:hypothetical protein